MHKKTQNFVQVVTLEVVTVTSKPYQLSFPKNENKNQKGNENGNEKWK